MFSLKPLTFYDFCFYILVLKKFIFSLQVVVAKEAIGNLGGMVRQLSLDQFENESRRMIPSNDLSYPTKKFTRQKSPQGLHKKVSLQHDKTDLFLSDLISFFKETNFSFMFSYYRNEKLSSY